MNKVQLAILTILAVFIMCSASWAATYYVATNGNDGYPGTLSKPWKRMGKANSTLQPGATVFIRQGTYRETIRPSRSGTEGNYITYANYNNDEVIITDVSNGVDLSNRSYIVLDGLKIMHVSNSWVEMKPNGKHNIIQNCYMEGAGGWSGIHIGNGADYNRILNNMLTASMQDPCGPDDLIYLRDGGRYNLIEGNTFSYAAHVAVNIVYKTDGPVPQLKNIIRNNIFKNLWHTNIAIYPNANYSLIEGNLILDAGEEYKNNNCGSERDRSMPRKDHKGIQLGSPNSIIRNNVLINNGNMSSRTKTGYPPTTGNRIYHNTFYENYYGIYSYGDPTYGNIFKNNIFFKNRNYEIYRGAIEEPNDDYYINNNVLGASIYNKPDGEQSLSYFKTNYPSEWHDNLEVDPKFVNESDRDLHLQPTSPMIDAGAFLTKTTSSGSGTTIQVEDARYFMDGWGIIEGDLIQLEGWPQTVRITNVNYNSNTITVDTHLAWNNGQGISLAYQGSAPDIGAYEYEGVTLVLSPPTGLKVFQSLLGN